MEEAIHEPSGSSWRKRLTQMEGDEEIDSASEAGDIGDRAIRSRSNSSLRLSRDCVAESGGAVFPVLICSGDPALALQPPSDKKEIPKMLEYASCLIYLAVFGIIGVITRYHLQKLFGPDFAGVTSNEGVLCLHLPSNMVGSFLMGWVGVVFKADIARVSNFIAIGMTTGFLGSLTSFSGWNQIMLELSSQGRWLSAAVGFLVGLFLAAYSIIFGVETAKGFRLLLERKLTKQPCQVGSDSLERQLGVTVSTVYSLECVGVTVAFVLMLALLGGLCGAFLREEFSNGGDKAQLWLGCLVGPLGVWIRWFLARYNGCGFGRAGHYKWIPFGTLTANVWGSCIMAALATLNKAVNTKTGNTVTRGMQFGFTGCLSTVPTFVAEFNAMRESKHPWQAYAYTAITVCLSFGFGTLIYSVPVWSKAFDRSL